MSKSRILVAAALALGTTLATGVAQARDADVQWSVTIGSPVHGPVYVPRHVQPAVVYQPRPVYVEQHRHYRQPTHWDRDGDGIPNRHDRRYNPSWDRDGDGVSNRHDRDIDGDGIPNHRDRNDYRRGQGYGHHVGHGHAGHHGYHGR